MAQQLVYVSTNKSRLCPICGEESLDGDRFEDACNHILRHGLKRLHVGQETRETTMVSRGTQPWRYLRVRSNFNRGTPRSSAPCQAEQDEIKIAGRPAAARWEGHKPKA
jgi:hypothetical protein